MAEDQVTLTGGTASSDYDDVEVVVVPEASGPDRPQFVKAPHDGLSSADGMTVCGTK